MSEPVAQKKELTEAQRQNWLKCLEKRRENMARRAMEKMKAVEEAQALSKKKRDVINSVRKRIKKDDLPNPEDIIIPSTKRPPRPDLDPWQDREDAIVNRIIEAVSSAERRSPSPESPPSAPLNAAMCRDRRSASPPRVRAPTRPKRPYVRKIPVPEVKEPKFHRPCYPPAPTPPAILRWV